MKYLSVLLVLCLSFATTLSAKNNPSLALKLSVTVANEKTVDVTLVNLQQQRTKIRIESLDGADVYFQEVITKHNGYRKRLNLNNLDAGKYVLTVENGSEKRQQVIVIHETQGMMLSSIK